MNVFICLKEPLYFRGRRFKKGEELHMEGEPTDGKGNSLVDEKNPAFRLERSDGSVSNEPVPQNTDLQDAADADPRTNSQIRRDIKDVYGETPSMTMKKINLLALELKLKMLHGKDAAIKPAGEIGMNDEMTLAQAQELVR